MYRFHVCVHALPSGSKAGNRLDLGNRSISTLAVDPADLNVPLSTSFEEAAEALVKLPRLFFEPDGSFVWVSPPNAPATETAWQIEGYLFDRGGRLIYVELKGTGPATAFDDILQACGWPAVPLVFQLVREAVFVDEAEFRHFAAGIAQETV